MDQIQKTALKETAKTVAGLTALAIIVPTVIFLVPFEVIGAIFSLIAFGMGTKMIYDIKLGQAKADAEKQNG